MRLIAGISALIALSSVAVYAAPLTMADMMPVVGDKQVYKVVENTAMSADGGSMMVTGKGTGTQTSVVAALSKGSLATVFVSLSTQTMNRTQGKETIASTSHTMEVSRLAPNGVYTDSHFQVEGHDDDSVDVGRTSLELKLPCDVGTTWNVGRLTFNDGYSLSPISTAVSSESVEVPAGKFDNCMKVESDCPNGIEGYVDQDGQKLEILSSKVHFTTWYCARVGVVKEISYTQMRLRPEGREDAPAINIITSTTTEMTENHPAQK